MPVTGIGNWHPGIGDPTAMGWFTVFSYYGTALVCMVAALRVGQRAAATERTFWVALVVVMAILGVCKQFNLLSAITELGRMVARSQGWIAQRREFQKAIMVAVAMGGLALVALLLSRLPRAIVARHWVVLLGVGYLVVFVALRAISLHGYESMLKKTLCGLRVNWIGELGGITAIGGYAVWYVVAGCRSV